jgi:hypothetical protein
VRPRLLMGLGLEYHFAHCRAGRGLSRSGLAPGSATSLAIQARACGRAHSSVWPCKHTSAARNAALAGRRRVRARRAAAQQQRHGRRAGRRPAHLPRRRRRPRPVLPAGAHAAGRDEPAHAARRAARAAGVLGAGPDEQQVRPRPSAVRPATWAGRPGPWVWKDGFATLHRRAAVRRAAGRMGGCMERPAVRARVLRAPRPTILGVARKQASLLASAAQLGMRPRRSSTGNLLFALPGPDEAAPKPRAGTATGAPPSTVRSWTGTARPASRWRRS